MRGPARANDTNNTMVHKLAAALQAMLKRNPERMDYYKQYTMIVADYNREKDRVTIEETFARLFALVQAMEEEDKRAVREGLSEPELAIFDKLLKDGLSKKDREQVKQASKRLLEEILRIIGPIDRWVEKETTRGMVESAINDEIFRVLPTPPFSEAEKQALALKLFDHVMGQSLNGEMRVA